MKAEEKTFAFMFFSVVLQFVYSLRTPPPKKKTTKKKTVYRDGGGRLRGTRAEGQEGRRAKCSWRITGNSSNKY